MNTFSKSNNQLEWENLRTDQNTEQSTEQNDEQWVPASKLKKVKNISGGSRSEVNQTNSDSKSSVKVSRHPKSYDELPIIKMRRWASSKKPLNEMMEIYNSNKRNWEHPNFIQKNINTIIEELARAWRHDVLNELKKTNPNYRNSSYYMYKGLTPYHKLVWPFEEEAENMNEDSIYNLKLTFLALIGMGFNMFLINKQYEDENEIFIGALIADSSPIRAKKPEYVDILYEYFTETWTNFTFIQTLLSNVLNRSFNDPSKVNDKILYIIHKYKEQAVQKICEYIFNMQHSTTQGKKNEYVIKVCESILLTPSSMENYHRYLMKYNLNEIRESFVKSVIKNFQFWSVKFISGIEDIDEEEKEQYKYQCYSNIMIVFGVFYSNRICKDEILLEINNFINTDNKCTNKSVLFFLENSSIDLKNMTNSEKIFVSNYIKKFFSPKANVLTKINIKNTFNKLLGYGETNTEDITDEINSFIIN